MMKMVTGDEGDDATADAADDDGDDGDVIDEVKIMAMTKTMMDDDEQHF